MVLGYNVSLSLNSKTLLGRTQEDLNISARTKESITKDDNGVKSVAVTGHDITFAVSALMDFNPSTGATKLDRDDVIALALKTGAEAVIPFTYTATGGDTYNGNVIITGYSESTSADPDTDSTVSLNLQVTGAMTKQA